MYSVLASYRSPIVFFPFLLKKLKIPMALAVYVNPLPSHAGGVVVTTPASTAGGTGSIPGTGSCDVKIWLSTLGTVYPS